MNVRRWAIVGATAALMAAVSGDIAARAAQAGQHDHGHAAPGAAGGPSAQMPPMMQRHQQMMAEMRAADSQLQALVQQMQEARGEAKVEAIAAIVTRLVEQRTRMHEQMMRMHDEMMSHMMQPGRGGRGSQAPSAQPQP